MIDRPEKLEWMDLGPIRSYPDCIGISAVVPLGLGIAETFVLDLYGMLLVSGNAEAEGSIQVIAAASIASDIVAVHIHRVASHPVRGDDDLGVAAGSWRIGRGRSWAGTRIK